MTHSNTKVQFHKVLSCGGYNGQKIILLQEISVVIFYFFLFSKKYLFIGARMKTTIGEVRLGATGAIGPLNFKKFRTTTVNIGIM